MEITGKIIAALPEAGGTSRSGNAWRKREYVLETHDTYPKKVCFNFFGERIDQYPLNVGDEVTVSFDLESREYNGRWYTDVRAWKSQPAQGAQPGAPVQGASQMPQGGYPVPPAPADLTPAAPGTDDELPF